MSANAVDSNTVKETNRSKLESRRIGIMKLSAKELILQKE